MSKKLSKKLKRALALAALMVGAGSLTAKANATEGWYGRIDGGYSVDGSLDQEIEIEGVGSGSADLDLDNDWMASGGIGYAFGAGFRLEGELAYRNNDFRGHRR